MGAALGAMAGRVGVAVDVVMGGCRVCVCL